MSYAFGNHGRLRLVIVDRCASGTLSCSIGTRCLGPILLMNSPPKLLPDSCALPCSIVVDADTLLLGVRWEGMLQSSLFINLHLLLVVEKMGRALPTLLAGSRLEESPNLIWDCWLWTSELLMMGVKERGSQACFHHAAHVPAHVPAVSWKVGVVSVGFLPALIIEKMQPWILISGRRIGSGPSAVVGYAGS
ncbi:hypothetical protein ACLOJK_029207 [Asimina triloba]